MPMVVLPLTIEVVTSITPPRIELETMMTERETESTWIRETIKVEEAMTTTPHREGAATSPERAEAATTVI